MCGLAGFHTRTEVPNREAADSLLRAMGDAIQHRGPDDFGCFLESNCGAGISFRRLAILDVSPTGAQPMTSYSKRYTMAYNGEVYNFKRIACELEKEGKLPPLRGGSDTEVMLAAIEAWGVEGAVQRFVGMFAIALWDHQERTLHLIRDRLGVKPLYYGWFGDTLLFGSELKALRAHPSFRAELNLDALSSFLQWAYVPAPHSIYKGVRKLPAGTILTIEMKGDPEPRPFWSAAEVARRGVGAPYDGTYESAVSSLEDLLTDAVGLRMIADVPLGAFLSGGTDSSLVVALMQAQSAQPVHTYTIGFDRSDYDEAAHARDVAAHLGTHHTELYVSEAETLAVVPRLADMFDEPFADPSQIPTFLVSQMARKHATVALSGDGGDELFGGYNRYAVGEMLWGLRGKVPRPARGAAAAILGGLPAGFWQGLYHAGSWALPKRLRIKRLGERIGVLSSALRTSAPAELYGTLLSHWSEPDALVPGGCAQMASPSPFPEGFDLWRSMLLHDQTNYMQEDVLHKVDRASMACSLEAREPLLDHRLVELAWTFPPEWRSGKRMLKDVLDRHVPQALWDRPKQGFSAPIGDWLRGPLKNWASDLLAEDRIRREGVLRSEPIQKVWNQVQAGGAGHTMIWNVLMFQAWRARWLD